MYYNLLDEYCSEFVIKFHLLTLIDIYSSRIDKGHKTK